MFASSRAAPSFQAATADAFTAKIRAVGQHYMAVNPTGAFGSLTPFHQIAVKLGDYTPRKQEATLPDQVAFLLDCYFALPQFDNALATLMDELYLKQFGKHITRTLLIQQLSMPTIQALGIEYLTNHINASEHAQANQLIGCVIVHPTSDKLIFKPSPQDLWSFLLTVYATFNDTNGLLATRIETLVTNVFQVRFDKIDSHSQPLTLPQIANSVKEKIQPILNAAVTATGFKEEIKALGKTYLTAHPENLFSLFSDITHIAKCLRDYTPASEDATAMHEHTDFFIDCYFNLPNYNNNLAAIMRAAYSDQFGKNLEGNNLIQAIRIETIRAIGRRYLAKYPEKTLTNEHQQQAMMLFECRILHSETKEVINNPSPAQLWLFLMDVYSKLTKTNGTIARRIEAMVTNTFDNIFFEKVFVAGHNVLPLPPTEVAAKVKKNIWSQLVKAGTVIELREVIPQESKEEKSASPAHK